MIADSGKYTSFILYVYMKRFYIESTSNAETSMKMTVLLPGCPSEFLLDRKLRTFTYTIKHRF